MGVGDGGGTSEEKFPIDEKSIKRGLFDANAKEVILTIPIPHQVLGKLNEPAMIGPNTD